MKLVLIGVLWFGPFVLTTAGGQSNPALELEGAIANEQVNGDLKAAIMVYQRISSDKAASREVRAKALVHLADCYEKLGQPARKVYEEIVHDFADQPAAAQARARLAAYDTRNAPAVKDFKAKRLTANTADLTIQAAGLSPDGQRIAYADELGIHVRVIATAETRLLAGTRDQVFVQWMPDGESVRAQAQNELGETTEVIVSVRADQPSIVPVPNAFLSSPDGSQRAGLSADRLRLMAARKEEEGHGQVVWTAPSEGALDQYVWCPDNRRIAIIRSTKGDNGYQSTSTLEVADTAKSGPAKVLVTESKKLYIGSVAWASRTRIVVTVNVDTAPNQYESNLWELRLDGDGNVSAGGLRKLTNWTDFPIRPGSLSTDGHRLVFIRSFRQRDVYVAKLEDGGKRMGPPRRLTLDLNDDYPTAWSSDSKSVILTSNRIGGVQTIFRQDIDKETAERVVVAPGQQVMGRLTADGQSLMFMNRFPPSHPVQQLMFVPIGGGVPRPVPHMPNPGWHYQCSTAGVCINAARENESGPYVVSEFDLSKGQGREIYRESHIASLSLSPDGKWIADTAGKGKDTKIIVRSFTTGVIAREIAVQGAVQLTNLTYASDGQGFYAGDASPNQVRELYIDLAGKTFVLYRQPASVWGIWGIPSPDGRYMAMVLLTDDSNVYMVEDF